MKIMIVENMKYDLRSFRQVVPNLTEDATSTGPIHQEAAMLGFTASPTLCSVSRAV